MERLKVSKYRVSDNGLLVYTGTTFSKAITGSIISFKISGNKVFYIDSSGSLQSYIYDSSVGAGRDLALSDFSNPLVHALNFSNNRLYDFYDWVKFSYGRESFKVVWSPQTGFFIFNELNNLVGHSHANFTPYELRIPPRMIYNGEAFFSDDNKKVYFPILRSGQPEQIFGGDILYPLGMELMELDLDSKIPSQTAQVGQQMIVSGAIQSYFNGHEFVEYGFTEKPVIQKTPSVDYDQWPYGSLLERRLPQLGELESTQFSDLQSAVSRKDAPYTVKDLEFTATTASGQTGALSSAAFSGSAPDRKLRYSTDLSDGNADDEYAGSLDKVYYDNAEKAIIAEFTSAPSTLEAGKDHPSGILIDDVLYEFMYTNVASGVLKGYYFTDENPFTSGTKYNVKIPEAVLLKTPEIDEQVNASPVVNLEETTLSNFKSNSLQTESGVNRDLQSSSVTFGLLQNKITGKGLTLNPQANSNRLFYLNSRGRQDRLKYGFKAKVNSKNGVMFFNDEDNDWNFYNFTAPATFAKEFNDLSRPSGLSDSSEPRGVAVDDDFWIFYFDPEDNRRNKAYCYSFDNTSNTIVAKSSRDIPSSIFVGSSDVFSHGTNIFVMGPSSSSSTGVLIERFDASGSGIPRNHAADSFEIPNEYFPSFPLVIGDILLLFKERGDNDSEGRSVGVKWIGYRTSGNTFVRDTTLDGEDNSGPYGTVRDPLTRIRRGTRLQGFINVEDSSSSFFQDLEYDNGDNEVTGLRGFTYGDVFSQDPGDEGYIKNGYKSKLSVPDAYNVPAGQTQQSSLESLTNLELTGLWNDSDNNTIGSNLYLALSSDTANFSNLAAMESNIRSSITHIKFVSGVSEYTMILSDVPSGDVQQIENTGTKSIIFNLKVPLAASEILRTIIQNAVNQNAIDLEFKISNAVTITENKLDLQPNTFSAKYKTDVEVTFDKIQDDINVINPDNSDQQSLFRLPAATFTKIKGSESGKFYYYKKTTDNPLPINPLIYSFVLQPPRLTFRYIKVQTAVRDIDLLRARVYKYKCRFKWVDQAGIEHRSQFSDEIQLFSNSDIGKAGNQPSFIVNNLNLTNRLDSSLSIEVYRTENLLSSFKLLKEVKNNHVERFQRIVDNVLDDDLGAVAGPNNILISGAKFCLSYKSRFILYGFPEKPNRVIVSSPVRNFTNQSIDFKNQGQAGDLVEILLDSEVTCIRSMDQYLVIYTKSGVYTWSVNENGVNQPLPVEVTSLVDLSAKDALSAERVQDGLLFLTQKGIWLISRSLASAFVGKDVQDFEGEILDIKNLSDANETRFITTSLDHPILVYNYRFKRWSIFKDLGVISSALLRDSFLFLSKDGKVWEESEESEEVQDYLFETGWIGMGDIQNFQRFREVFLLMDHTDLRSLSLEFFYDFSPLSSEVINYNFDRFQTREDGVLTQVKPYLEDNKQFRFQPRRQKCSSFKIIGRIEAKKLSLNGLRIGYNVIPGSYLKSSQAASRVL